MYCYVCSAFARALLKNLSIYLSIYLSVCLSIYTVQPVMPGLSTSGVDHDQRPTVSTTIPPTGFLNFTVYSTYFQHLWQTSLCRLLRRLSWHSVSRWCESACPRCYAVKAGVNICSTAVLSLSLARSAAHWSPSSLSTSLKYSVAVHAPLMISLFETKSSCRACSFIDRTTMHA